MKVWQEYIATHCSSFFIVLVNGTEHFTHLFQIKHLLQKLRQNFSFVFAGNHASVFLTFCLLFLFFSKEEAKIKIKTDTFDRLKKRSLNFGLFFQLKKC